MKRPLLICSLLFLLLSCSEEEAHFTMPEEDLMKLLYDVQAAEAAIQTVHSNAKDSVVSIYYDQVYEMHGVNQEILMENIEVLKKHPEKSHKIYKRMLEYHKKLEKQKK